MRMNEIELDRNVCTYLRKYLAIAKAVDTAGEDLSLSLPSSIGVIWFHVFVVCCLFVVV